MTSLSWLIGHCGLELRSLARLDVRLLRHGFVGLGFSRPKAVHAKFLKVQARSAGENTLFYCVGFLSDAKTRCLLSLILRCSSLIDCNLASDSRSTLCLISRCSSLIACNLASDSRWALCSHFLMIDHAMIRKITTAATIRKSMTRRFQALCHHSKGTSTVTLPRPVTYSVTLVC